VAARDAVPDADSDADSDADPAVRDRALGALWGLAVGDALGMPTQLLPREAVTALFGRLQGFEAAPEVNEISRGMPRGRVTDDTDQALIVARALVAGGGHADPADLARRLLAWEAAMRAAGSADLLGPSTSRALEAVGRGVPPTETGRWGDTNGAAMRIAAVGVLLPPEPLEALVDRVREVSRPTHDTGIAIAGASAVAAAVSAGIAGATWPACLDAAVRAAELGRRRGSFVGGADVARRIRWAVGLVTAHPDDEAGEDAALDLVDGLVGTGVATQESVPAAFALVARHPDDPWRAALLAAGLGGDSDTVAAMAGAIAGARAGLSGLPADAVALVREVNDLDLEPVVADLLRLRAGG
jgi:ADP-ribosylglycohydrolase